MRVTHDYDTQLIESVAVRRRRARDALLFGSLRTRRTFDENVVKLFIGIVIAAVICAGCVGWSFLQNELRKQRTQFGTFNSAPATVDTEPVRSLEA